MEFIKWQVRRLRSAHGYRSSLVWRFHHHVSHHMFPNDDELDQDTYTSYPLMRLDAKAQPWKWYRAKIKKEYRNQTDHSCCFILLLLFA